MRAWLVRIFAILFLLFLASQFIRPNHTNPTIDPNHEIHATLTVDPYVAQIFSRSCNDCHSYRTVWPWYSHMAPVSWLVAYDVREGRRKLNFSEWSARHTQDNQKLLNEICSEVSDGEMPGWSYALLHREARLSAADSQAVCAWARIAVQTLAASRTKAKD